MKTWTYIAGIVLCLGVTDALADPSDPLILEFSIRGDRIQVAPRGDQDLRFTIDPHARRDADGGWQVAERMRFAHDTLYLDDEAYPPERLGRMEINTEGRNVRVLLYDRGPDARARRRPADIRSLGETVSVDTGTFVRGYVLNFGGDVRVEGEVNRSVVSIGGDVYVEDDGVVRGSVISLGGDVHKTEYATVYGDLYAGNRQRFRPRWYEDPDQNVFQFNVHFDYNRVTGALPWAVFAVGPERGPAPRLLVDVGYAFESELWHYRFGLGRDGWWGPLYYAGGYRETRDDDQIRIGGTENTIFALFFSTDYRDYYFAEGFRLDAGWGWGEDRSLRLGYFNEELSPLQANTSQWSLFGSSFPPNYDQLKRTGDTSLADDFEGRLVFLRTDLVYRYPEYSSADEGMWKTALVTEWSDPDIKSDFSYSRYYAYVMRRQPLWRNQQLRVRVLAGGAGGDLPATRLYYLGGIGSLRGYDYKEFFGDRHWLTNVEYGWSLGGLELFALFDAGQIGTDGDWTSGPVLWDVGAGAQIQRTIRVQGAWAGTESHRKLLITVRFSKPF